MSRCQGKGGRSACDASASEWTLRLASPREIPIACGQALLLCFEPTSGLSLEWCKTEFLWHRHPPCGWHALEHTLPDPPMGPAGEAFVKGGRRTRGSRHIAPAAPGLQNRENVRDHPTVVYPGLPRQPPRQMRLDGRPSFVRKPEQMRHNTLPRRSRPERRLPENCSDMDECPA